MDKLEFTGERVVWNAMKGDVVKYLTYKQHIQRYVKALEYVYKKTVLDVACGSGYGSMILAQVAKKVIGYDIDKTTIKYAQHVNQYTPDTEFHVADFNKDKLKKADIAISFETIEHLQDPRFFLKYLDVEEIYLSIPINAPSKYHIQVYRNPQSIIDFLTPSMHIVKSEIQENKFFIAYGLKR